MPSVLSGSILQFGDFQLDCGRFELSHKGHPLRVERKPMELLILLASCDGQMVTREEIAERLWSNEVFVDTEHGINTAIRKLRYLLRDDPAHPQFIQTVTGMGYRFVAYVSVASATTQVEVVSEPVLAAAPPARRRTLAWSLVAGACLILTLGGIALYRSEHRSPQLTFTQLTDFTDSAVAPALSPDGRMMAFIRGASPFFSTDPIYVKMLPNGEPKRITDDNRQKYGLAFSPDGSEIAYTVFDSSGFSTYAVSTLGGESHLLLKNASGLVWLDPQRLLYSTIRSGIHMGVVTATTSGSGLRDIYFPAHERGMAHYSFPSPDRHWALVVEMNGSGLLVQCRLVSLEAPGTSKLVGPTGACISAGWSPNGAWMYFTAEVWGHSHIWRQHFPDGQPQQITFGPTNEIGIAVEPDGKSLITSLGTYESAIWIHDGNSERPLSSEGEVINFPLPVFSPDGRVLYYLLRRDGASGTELWRTVVDSGQSEAVLPGVSMNYFDLSPDGKQVAYTTAAPDETTQLWLAPVDRSSLPAKVEILGARYPHFGARGQILFMRAEGNVNYLEQINPDGTRHSKVFPYPVLDLLSISPNRQWMIAPIHGTAGGSLPYVAAIPADGGAPRRICESYCEPTWSPDGKWVFVPVEEPSQTGPGRSLAIPLGPGESPPELPAHGIAPRAEPGVVPGAVSIPRGHPVPGNDLQHYAWVNVTVHRNLYRISLP